jgi:hypothetical protein
VTRVTAGALAHLGAVYLNGLLSDAKFMGNLFVQPAQYDRANLTANPSLPFSAGRHPMPHAMLREAASRPRNVSGQSGWTG